MTVRGWFRLAVEAGGLVAEALSEWPAPLDVGKLVGSGWQPVPFRQFLLKIHSRCNLSCDYCYMYTMADQSWRHRPMTMAPSLLVSTAQRIAEHARTHRLSTVRIILHGGEPLLAGHSYLADAVCSLRQALTSLPGVVEDSNEDQSF